MLYVIHNEIQNKKQALDNRLNQLLDKRKSIVNIVKNTDIDEEQKKILIQQILQNNIYSNKRMYSYISYEAYAFL